jgi:hypothetical protein
MLHSELYVVDADVNVMKHTERPAGRIPRCGISITLGNVMRNAPDEFFFPSGLGDSGS